jgi:hypothetical protein
VDALYARVTSSRLGFQLLDLRKEFGQLFLYELGNEDYVFRPLNIKELEAIDALDGIVADDIIDEWVVKTTFLATTKQLEYLFESAPAGWVAVLSLSIIERSSPLDLKGTLKVLEDERAKLQVDEGLIKNMVLAGTGHILGDAHGSITYREQIKYLALSENILGRKLEVQTLPTGKEGKAKKKQMSAATAAMLSKEAADKPDFEADNKSYRAL